MIVYLMAIVGVLILWLIYLTLKELERGYYASKRDARKSRRYKKIATSAKNIRFSDDRYNHWNANQ